MFERLDRLPQDPILGLMALFRADSDPRKVDLGVGVYRDDRGETPVLQAVKRAEKAVFEKETTKSYVAPVGNAAYNTAMERLVFGDSHSVLGSKRVRTVQAPGGCGALRLGAELIKVGNPQAVVHVSTPTWANHVPLIGGSGLKLERYPYFDAATGGVSFGAMLDYIDKLPAGSVVLLHASCHNPTGADLSDAEWREIVGVLKRRKLLPYLDMAYQGLGRSVDDDAFAIRLVANEMPEALIAVSCSKNFGLYRERVGVLHVISETPDAADAVLSQLVRIARTIYSMPPDHGAAIVHQVLSDDALRTAWVSEVNAMRARVTGLRQSLVDALSTACPQRDFRFIERQRGMFSFLGVNAEQVRKLREEHHVYMTDDSRMNIAGLRKENISYFANAVAAVLNNVS
jgi:aspartate/tyrosine/aromatic aminotransferase